jgi:hypothetical protein
MPAPCRRETTCQRCRNLLTMHFRMLPCSVVLVFGSLQVMTECNSSMMRRLLVIACLVKLGGLTMMFGSVFIVLGCLFVMLVDLVLCHSILPTARKRTIARV